MSALYVSSVSENAGKTLLCAGLGKYWLNSGKKVGYIKLPAEGEKDKSSGDSKNNIFIHQLLGLREPAETPANSQPGIKEAYARAAQGKDIMIIEGSGLNVSKSLIESLDAKVVVMHDYSTQLSVSIGECRKLGTLLLGMVINKVPRNKISLIQSQSAGDLAKAGIKLLGIIPEDRILMTLTVAELAEALHGKIMNNADKGNELVENIMLGALAFDPGVPYFNIKNNKAIILKGDRPDMQLAALQTSLRCMVISGGLSPIPAVMQQATAKKVPIVTAVGDVKGLVTAVESATNRIKFNQEKKLPRLLEILQQNLNMTLLVQGLKLGV